MNLAQPHKWLDTFFLCIFTALITYHPHFLQAEVNLYELGIYLPGINAILDGLVPFRDFFHLRGPYELYFPAALMKLFGEQVSVLQTYFYLGTVFTILIYVLLAREIIQTRLVYLLCIPVLIARTFPRVVFTYWGGFRFALGALAIYATFIAIKKKNLGFVFIAGLISGIALFTSIEVGLSCVFAIGLTLLLFFLSSNKPFDPIKAIFQFILGVCLATLPYLVYLYFNQALAAYMDDLWHVMTQMQHIYNFHTESHTPTNLVEFVVSVLNPGSKYFKYLTPVYLFLFLSFYLFKKYKAKSVSTVDQCVLCLGLYGLAMYALAFRLIQASAFEMALQPSKVLLFFLYEAFLIALLSGKIVKHKPKWFYAFCIFLLVGSSLGYAIQRYNHRFVAFKYVTHLVGNKPTVDLQPLKDKPKVALDYRRVKGLVVPDWQADDFRQLYAFVDKYATKDDAIVSLDELAVLNFIVDRPFVNRFPMVIYNWMDEQWFNDFYREIQENPPKVVIMPKKHDWWFDEIYFKVPGNLKKHQVLYDYTVSNYTLGDETPSFYLYHL